MIIFMEPDLEEQQWLLKPTITCDKCGEDISTGDTMYIGRKSLNVYCHPCGVFLTVEKVEVDEILD